MYVTAVAVHSAPPAGGLSAYPLTVLEAAGGLSGGQEWRKVFLSPCPRTELPRSPLTVRRWRSSYTRRQAACVVTAPFSLSETTERPCVSVRKQATTHLVHTE